MLAFACSLSLAACNPSISSDETGLLVERFTGPSKVIADQSRLMQLRRLYNPVEILGTDIYGEAGLRSLGTRWKSKVHPRADEPVGHTGRGQVWGLPSMLRRAR